SSGLFLRSLLQVAAELKSHRREQLVLVIRFAARSKSLVERRGENRRGYSFVNRGLDSPAPFPGIGDTAGELRQITILDQRDRSKIEQPGSDHAAAAPDLGDVA